MIQLKCPKCDNEDTSMLEVIANNETNAMILCNVCSKVFRIKKDANRSKQNQTT